MALKPTAASSRSLIDFDTKIPQGCTVRAFLEAEATLCQDRDRANIDVFAGNVLLTPDDILNDLSQIVLGASTAIVPHDMPTCPCCEWESNGSHEMPPPCRHPSPTPMCQPSGSEPWPSISPTLPYMVENNGVPGDAIAQLGGTDLLLLVPPRIASVNGITAHLECKLSQSTRMMILQHQGEIWADDEIRFGLSTLALKSPCDYLFAWDPLFVSSLIRYGHLNALKHYADLLPVQAVIMTAVVIEGHWYPMVWNKQGSELQATTCGHAFTLSVALQALHTTVAKLCECVCHPIQFVQLPFAVTTCCGAMAIHFIDSVLHSVALPDTRGTLQTLHSVFREAFQQALPLQTPRPWIWGHGDETWKMPLRILLQEHGVPEDQLEVRSDQIAKSLGVATLAKIMASTLPWKELKSHANRVVPVLQLVMPSELQAVIAKKTRQGDPIGTKQQKHVSKGKGQGKGKHGLRKLDPQTLRIETGIFVCGDNPLPQLELSQLGSSSSGVVLTTVASAMPYMRAGKPISAGGVAIIVIDDSTNVFPSSLPVEHVRIPVICSVNGQPLLIDGRMFQLGSIQVTRRVNIEKFELVSIATCVVKIVLFRDQCGGDWTYVTQHPLKTLFTKLPVLQRCTDASCSLDCEAWHPAPSCTVEDPILEVWNKQWLYVNFAAAPPAQAEMFVAHFRLPQCLQVQIQTYSGIEGVYVEPVDWMGNHHHHITKFCGCLVIPLKKSVC